MGRKNTRNFNLPAGVRARHRNGHTYYYLDTGNKPRKEIALGKDYVLAMQKWVELSASETPIQQLITFRYVAERYLIEALPTKAPRTQKDNLRELTFLYQFFDNPPAPLEEIKPVHIQQYLDWRKQAKIRANREKALFSHIWNFARSHGLTDKTNPCAGVKGYKEVGRRSHYVSDQVFQAVQEQAIDPIKDALDLAYLTGQRPADLLKLMHKDIVERALMIQQNKTGTRLRIAIEGQLAQVIKRINSRKVMSLYLLNTHKGSKMTVDYLRFHFDRARNDAAKKHPELAEQIKNFQFRDLRAKAATDKEEQSGLQAAQDQLGHSSSQMTAHYVRNRKGKLVNPTR